MSKQGKDVVVEGLSAARQVVKLYRDQRYQAELQSDGTFYNRDGRQYCQELDRVLDKIDMAIASTTVAKPDILAFQMRIDPFIYAHVKTARVRRFLEELKASDNVEFVGDLVRMSRRAMLRTPNFGKKSLSELEGALAHLSLRFDMEVPNWPGLREAAAHIFLDDPCWDRIHKGYRP